LDACENSVGTFGLDKIFKPPFGLPRATHQGGKGGLGAWEIKNILIMNKATLPRQSDSFGQDTNESRAERELISQKAGHISIQAAHLCYQSKRCAEGRWPKITGGGWGHGKGLGKKMSEKA